MSESLARLVVTAVLVEGRTKAEVARDYGLSRQWVHELVSRFLDLGEAGLIPRSRRPRSNRARVPEPTEDAIVAVRKELEERGLDAGAHTIAYHLTKRGIETPSVATIWRILSRRGFITPQPQKRPKAAAIRFQAEMPNERWQEDITHWKLASGTDVEILNAIDDHSRFLVGSDALQVFKAADVVASFHKAAAAYGYPAELLTDIQAQFPAAPRGGRCALELECDRLGIKDINSRPNHPQTYNEVRPHRAIGRRPPAEAYAARPKATPIGPVIPPPFRLRRDRIDGSGGVTLRHDSRLHHIKVGRRFAGTRVLMLVAGLDVRIVTEDGELLRVLTLDPTRSYQPLGK